MHARRVALAIVVSLTAAALACSPSNGDAIPSTVYDASPLDAGGNPADPDGGTDSGSKDAAMDAPVDAPIDAPVTGTVVINEIFVATDLSGDRNEYVELRGTPGMPIDDLKLRVVDKNGKATEFDVANAKGDKMPASGLWSAGGAFVISVDHILSITGNPSWGLDDTAGAVQLVRGTTLLDVVGYGDNPDAGAVPMPAVPPTATVEGKTVTLPMPGRAFGRKTGAPDTHDNRADFCAMARTPSKPQAPCD